MSRLLRNASLLPLSALALPMLFLGQGPEPRITGKWNTDRSLKEARADACAVQLPDGRLLATGGLNRRGTLESAEFLGAAGYRASVSPMGIARSGHLCAALPDGRVLVAGGRVYDDSTSTTNAAEVYDPSSDSWTPIQSMREARVGATVTVLSDKRLLIAGGESFGFALATLEIFDPRTLTFSTVPGAMAAPRKGHAASLLRDGRVLIAGGSDGKNVLDTAEIFDPGWNSVHAIGRMTTPREGLSATLLDNGIVLLAGGFDGHADLSTSELFDSRTMSFTGGPPMGSARRGHQAFLMPHNNTVILVDGTASGKPMASAEQFAWWGNQYKGLFKPIGDLSDAVSKTTGGTTDSGVLILAGGKSRGGEVSAAAMTLPTATVTTDKPDYQPGDTVYLTGSGFGPNDVVHVVIHENPTTHPDVNVDIQADASGAFSNKPVYNVQPHDAGVTFHLIATGDPSGIWGETSFTDALNLTSVVVGPPTSVTVTAGNPASYSITATFAGSGSCSADLLIITAGGQTGLPAGTNPSFTTNPVARSSAGVILSTLDITTDAGMTPAGTYTFTVRGDPDSSCGSNTNRDAAATLVVNAAVAAATTTAVTSSQNPSVFGQSVSFTATVSSGSGTPTGSVQFKIDSVNFGAAVALVGGMATSGGTSSLSVGTHTVTADYIPTGNFTASSGSLAGGQTVNPAATTTTITNAVALGTPTVVGESYTVTWSVAVTAPGAGTPTGTVTITGGSGCGPVAVGAGTCMVTSTTAGAKSLVATYGGAPDFSGSASSAAPHTVNPAATTTTITNAASLLATPTVVGESYAVNWSVAVTAPGAGTPTGTVTITGGSGCGPVAVAVGTCMVTSTTAGAKTLVATYGGDSDFNGSASAGAPHTVNPAATTTTITNAASLLATPTVVGESYAVNWSVAVTAPGAGTPTGTVTITGGSGCGPVAVAVGTCMVTSTTAGAKTLVATYGGDSDFNGSASAGAPHTVNPAATTTTITNAASLLATPTVVGESYAVNWSVAVTAPGVGTPTGTVTITGGSGCAAAVAVGTCMVTSTTAGAKSLVATYGGAPDFSGSASSAAPHTVNPASTSFTAVGDAPDPSTFGFGYTATWTVGVVAPGGGAPGGTVTVSDGTASCPATPVAAGACIIPAGATVGAKTLTYTYSGDSNYNGSAFVSSPPGGGHTVSPAYVAAAVTVAPTSQQYSDKVTFSISIADPGYLGMSPSSVGTMVYFAVGTQLMVASCSLTQPGGAMTPLLCSSPQTALLESAVLFQMAPGPHTVTASIGYINPNYVITGLTTILTITREDARAFYTGALFASTASATSSTATVTLSATIKDITAVDAVGDANPGDIRNAKVTFVDRGTNTDLTGCINLPVGLVSAADTKVGTATCNWTTNIGASNSASYTIGIRVNNYYTRDASDDNDLVTVSKPLTDFITGGGHLVLASSSGLKAGDAGTKNNFGFNVKYNKSGTNLQGNINTIVRKTEPDGLHVYQIKGNAMTSLSVQAKQGKAVFNGKANIQDITNPLAPFAVDGNATLQVTMTDKGEPGNMDTIGITVWNKQGGLWFSSNFNGTATVEQLLNGGNLVVH